MLNKAKIALCVALFSFGVSSANAASQPQAGANPASYQYGMKPYPAARPGYTRLTIHLPKLRNENDAHVKLIPGRTMMVDCNVSSFSGQLVPRVAQGWGFNYYDVVGIRGPMQSMKACLDNKKRKAFVPVNLGMNALVRYNSKLPVVVYVPNGFNVQYQVLLPQSKGMARPE